MSRRANLQRSRPWLILCALTMAMLSAASAQAAPVWQAPENASESVRYPGGMVEKPQIVIDGFGTATSVWELSRRKHRTVIQSSSRPAGGAWSAPKTISSTRSSEPEIAVNAAGDVVAVWEHLAGRRHVIQRASKSPGGSWAEPITLSQGRQSISPTIAIGEAGEALALWEHSTTHRTTLQSTSRSPLGDWSAPVDLPQRGPTEGFEGPGPQLVIDASGEATAVWTRLSPSHSLAVQSSSRPAGGSWSRPTTLSDERESDSEPQTAVNAAGEVVTLWEQTDYLGRTSIQSASRPPRSTWSQPTTIFESRGYGDFGFQVAIDDAGEAIAVWGPNAYGSPTPLMQSASRPLGGIWSQPVSIFSRPCRRVPTGNPPPYSPGYTKEETVCASGEPQIAINGADETVAVWESQDGIIRGTFRSPAGAWSPASQLSQAPKKDHYNEALDVGVSPAGEAIAVWVNGAVFHSVIRSSSRPAGGS